MTLSPEAAAFVTMALASGAPPMDTQTPVEARKMIDGMLQNPGFAPELDVIDTMIPLADAQLLMRVISPNAAPRGVIVFMHGGGWVTGTAANHEPVGRQIAAATGCIVAIPDYRLAPEHPFPIPLQDCYTAAVWAAQTYDLPLVLMGDSAGGNLVAAVTHMAKAEGTPNIAAQVLVYPVTDCAMDTPSYRDPANNLLLTPATGIWFWSHYIADRSQWSDPRASVLRAADLSGLPPAIVVLASHDVLRDEGQAYAERLQRAGVPCQIYTAQGEIHGFFVMGGIMPAAGKAMAYVAENLAQYLK